MSHPPERNGGPVTQRYRGADAGPTVSPAVSVTRRYGLGDQTNHGDGSTDGDNDGGRLAVIADRYRVVAGPLGIHSGEAEVFRCQDEAEGREVAVKLYRYYATPNPEVIAELLGIVHPNIVRLFTHGRWSGRYYEVMEFCAGGVFADRMPCDEARLRACLPGLVAGLGFCHRQGIVHRDIKPNNLFWREPDCRTPLIGDFGISSYLDNDALAKVTRSAANLTLDYSAPEFLDRHEVGPKTDYYALGITLLHLLAGRSPFHGLPPHDVLVAHLRQRIPRPANLSVAFERLLTGLLAFDPNQRWGEQEVLDWLAGAEDRNISSVISGLQRPPPLVAQPQRPPPFPAYPQADDPVRLAAGLDRFDAAAALFSGRLRKWLSRYVTPAFDDDLRQLEQGYQDLPRQAIVRLRYLLDPHTPLLIDEQPVSGLPALAALLAQERDEELQQDLHQALWDEAIEAWIIAGQQAGERSRLLAEKIAALRHRVRYTRRLRIGLFALRYLLDPRLPLTVAETLQVTTPTELAQAWQDRPEALTAPIATLLDTMRLEEWLRAVEFPDWAAQAEFLREIRIHYLDRPKLAVQCFAWRFLPQPTFPLGDRRVATHTELAALFETSPEHLAIGLELLAQGWLAGWLLSTGQVASLQAFTAYLEQLPPNPRAQLEAILRLLDPSLVAPRLTVAPTEIRLGVVMQGSTVIRELQIDNTTRGWLYGAVAVDCTGVVVMPLRFEGRHSVLTVKIQTHGLASGLYQGRIRLFGNGGEAQVVVHFVVAMPLPPRRPWWQRLVDRLVDVDSLRQP